MKKVSVIIPIYNAEKYLVDSFLNYKEQNYKNIEFILIDDGSTDNSWKICEKFAAEDSRVKCIYQENQGVSAARNLGINVSDSFYIAFFDADDYVEKDMITQMVSIAESSHADIVSCGIAMELELKNKKKVRQHELKYSENITIYNSKDKIKQNILKIWEEAVPYNVVNKLYKKSIIMDNSIRFSKLSMGEDLEFNSKVMLYANSLVMMPQSFYRYIREREGAATSRYIDGWFKIREAEYFRMVEFFKVYLKTQELDEKYKEYISRRYINRVIGCMENEFRDNNPENKYKNIKEMICSDSVKNALIFGKKYSRKIRIIVFGMKHNHYGMVYLMIFFINSVKRIFPRVFEYLKYRR